MSYAYPQVKVVSPDDREILPDAGKAISRPKKGKYEVGMGNSRTGRRFPQTRSKLGEILPAGKGKGFLAEQ